MKQLLILILMLGMFSCQEQRAPIESIETVDLSPKQIDSILTEFKFEYERPIILNGKDQLLIPISTQTSNKRNKTYSGKYKSTAPRYWNVLFYNQKSGETRMLTKDKVNISNIHTNLEKVGEETEMLDDKVLFEIRIDDFNKDKKLNQFDPEYLFSSNITGEKLIQISPSNEDLQHFTLLPNSEQILVKTLRDVNHDSIFNNEDESVLYKAEFINENWQLKEIIDSTGRNEIGKLFFDQWLKKK